MGKRLKFSRITFTLILLATILCTIVLSGYIFEEIELSCLNVDNDLERRMRNKVFYKYTNNDDVSSKQKNNKVQHEKLSEWLKDMKKRRPIISNCIQEATSPTSTALEPSFFIQCLFFQNQKFIETFEFIQIGANDGEKFDFLNPILQNSTKITNGILIEPVPWIFENLKKTYERRKSWTFIQAAIDVECESDKIEFVAPKEILLNNEETIWQSGTGHIYHGDEPQSEQFERISVSCLTLRDLIDEYRPTTVHLLLMDMEGNDFAVLQTMIDSHTGRELIRPHLIVAELLSDNDRAQAASFFAKHNYHLFEAGTDWIAIDIEPLLI